MLIFLGFLKIQKIHDSVCHAKLIKVVLYISFLYFENSWAIIFPPKMFKSVLALMIIINYNAADFQKIQWLLGLFWSRWSTAFEIRSVYTHKRLFETTDYYIFIHARTSHGKCHFFKIFFWNRIETHIRLPNAVHSYYTSIHRPVWPYKNYVSFFRHRGVSPAHRIWSDRWKLKDWHILSRSRFIC